MRAGYKIAISAATSGLALLAWDFLLLHQGKKPPEPSDEERYIAKYRITNFYRMGSFYCDKAELTPEYRQAVDEVDKLAEKEVAPLQKGQPGYFHVFQQAKQRILREKYGIAWRTIQEMNPGMEIE